MRPKRIRSLLGAVFWASWLALNSAAHAELKPGDSFPELSAYKLEGSAPTLAGKVVLVDFWASWCGPCKKSFPAMEALQKKYAARGFSIVAISVDDKKANMDNFLTKTAPTFPTLWDSHQELVNRVDVHTMPSSFLIDAQGKVRFAHSGFSGAETIHQYENEIESLLKK